MGVSGGPAPPPELARSRRRKSVSRTRDRGIQIGIHVFHHNCAAAHLRDYAAELILSTFGAIEIAQAHDDLPDLVEAINREVIEGETKTPTSVLANCVGNTKILGTNLNRHE
jgi:hypothetical protein